MKLLKRIPGGAWSILTGGLLFLSASCWFLVEWTINYHWVPEGHSMLLRYKGPPLPIPGLGVRPPAKEGRFAEIKDGARTPAQLGVLQQMVGPGRHFYSPLWWECRTVEDTVVKPGEVGIVVSKMGSELPEGKYLVDGDLGRTESKGILRKVLPPGRYRINPYAYDVKKVQTEKIRSGTQIKQAGWVQIPTGYVGVVTNLTDNPITKQTAGIQKNVLPPGIYPVNSHEQQIDIVNIGYRELSIVANLKKGRDGIPIFEDSGEPMIDNDESGIEFPSNDGFNIRMDFTAIWGIMPDQAPDVIRQYGNVDAVEQKVVDPQIASICRIMGSRLGAVELLVGESRQQFQEDTSEHFRDVLESKGITVLNGLVRHIYIPQEVRTPIQEANIAAELKLTREQEEITAQTEALLREAEEKVALATEEIRVETEKLVAARLAEGNKEAQEITAETQQLVAAIDKKTAVVEADSIRLLGQAEAKSRQLQEEAKSDRFRLAVDAFGSGPAYNQWVFAQGLPEDIELDMLYAGEGTFWTDLRNFTEVMLGREALEDLQTQKPVPKRVMPARQAR